MPLAATGKIDKNRLREDYASTEIAGITAVRGGARPALSFEAKE
jgi:hypothetical protein